MCGVEGGAHFPLDVGFQEEASSCPPSRRSELTPLYTLAPTRQPSPRPIPTPPTERNSSARRGPLALTLHSLLEVRVSPGAPRVVDLLLGKRRGSAQREKQGQISTAI